MKCLCSCVNYDDWKCDDPSHSNFTRTEIKLNGLDTKTTALEKYHSLMVVFARVIPNIIRRQGSAYSIRAAFLKIFLSFQGERSYSGHIFWWNTFYSHSFRLPVYFWACAPRFQCGLLTTPIVCELQRVWKNRSITPYLSVVITLTKAHMQ